jgi:hypothetical protein
MSSTASGLNALASTTAIDIYKRNLKEEIRKALSQRDKVFTLFWGVAILFCKCRYPIRKPNPTEHRRFHILRNGTGNFLGRILHQIRQSQSHLYSALVSQITIFFIYYYAIFVFPAGERLFMAKLHRGNAYDRTVSILQLSVLEKKRIIFHNYQLCITIFYSQNYTNFIKAKI